jgi:excinuclease ABC subunit C
MATEESDKRKNLTLDLKKLLKLNVLPRIIDCFDVSHHQSKNLVGACVRFKDGKPDKNNFRRFNIKTTLIQDDYACLQEIVTRRYKNPKDLPDLILIDGGKGQLSAVRKIISVEVPVVALAKREETIFSQKLPLGKNLNPSKIADQFLIYVRDYAHHFAISFHRQKDSILL